MMLQSEVIMIKLIASDMDGTLLTKDSKLPKNMSTVLDELDSKDIPFVAASGRSLHSIENTFGPLANRICIVSDNGAVVKHKGNIVFSSVIQKDDWQAITKDALEVKETSVVFIGIDHAYCIINDESHREILTNFFTNAKEIQSLDEVEGNIIKITLMSLEHTKENFDEILYPKYGDRFNVVFGGAIWTDFMNKGVNKGEGLQKLLDLYDVDADHLMAFGDYHNDIQMLQLANHSYAVANAHVDVKEVVKHHIGSNEDNSVIKTILENI